jgi:hypothetical protein
VTRRVERFPFEVIDAQSHIGRFPGHARMHYSAEDLVDRVFRPHSIALAW